MGMAASQARLLTITARLSDNELRSQSINNAKMRLATQSAQASENYIKALNDANLIFNNYDSTGMAQSQLLTFNSMMMYSSYNNQYGLVDASGQLLVSESEAAMFKLANGNLNAYLKAHGLEYTSTYFDELGAIVNEDYPAPFDYIEPDVLQKMYEAYGSYESSLELENYKNYYQNFVLANDILTKSMREVLPLLLTSEGDPQLKLDEGGGSVSLLKFRDSIASRSDLSEGVETFKNGFMSSTNPYGLDYLKANGYITDDTYDYLKSIVDSVKSTTYTGNGGAQEAMEYISEAMTENNNGINVVTDDVNQTTTYTFDDVSITVDKDGKVTDYSPQGAYYETKDDGSQGDLLGTYTWSNTTGSLQNFINGLSYRSSNNLFTSQYSAAFDENGELSVTHKDLYIQDRAGGDAVEAAYDLLNYLTNVIFDKLTVNGLFNIEKLTNDLLSGESIPGIDINTELSDGSKLSDILNNYNSARENYLKFIVKDDYYQSLYDLLESGQITAKDLYDIDFVLKLLKEQSYEMTPNYETVVNEFIIDNMIENYGEPKYAWIDENDTANTGNADAKAQWLTNLFNRMKSGYKALENGLASSSQWLEYALESGLVSMEQVDKSFRWKSLDYKTCANITEQTDNSAAVAKAEAEYTRAMNDIDAKDSRYDMELKNIDTEHSALQQEYEVIKGVISKNIERTFKFSQQG